LKTFLRWCVETRVIAEDPLRGFTMRSPKTLPSVPTEEELRSVIAACADTLEGIRNRTLIIALADSGLRASEMLHLLIEDWRPADRGLFVRAGKGRKDRVACVGPTTMRALKTWLARHPAALPESFLFTDRHGRPLKPCHLVQILHRLSMKAGLPSHRRVSSARAAALRCDELAARWGRIGGSAPPARAREPQYNSCGTVVSWELTSSGPTAEPEPSSA
jgi:integrase/recombinase XerD